MGFGTVLTSTLFLAAILAIVGYMTMTGRGDDTAPAV